MSDEIGTGLRLGSAYVLEERIGSGGMGTVWRGRNTDTGQPVAIKMLADNLSQDPEVVARFIRERTALTSVRHQNLVRVQDLVAERDRVGLIMDLIDGTDAARLLTANGPMPAADAARLGFEVCQALAAIHAAGIIHRDLKPANILIDRATGSAHLADFGIAWIAGSTRLTAVNSVVGTPLYLAPELLTGGKAGPPCDVYALGICLYELLTGTPPFVGEHYAQILNQQMYASPAPNPAIPERMWPVIQAALAKDPGARPDAQTFGGMVYGAIADVDAANQQPSAGALPAAVPPPPAVAEPPAVEGVAQFPQQSPYAQTGYSEPPPEPISSAYIMPSDSFFTPAPENVEYQVPIPPMANVFSYDPPKPKRRRKYLWISIGSALVLVLGAGGVVYALGNHSSGKPTPIAGATTTHSASPSPTKTVGPLVHDWSMIGDAGDSVGGRDGVATGVKWTVSDSTHGSAGFKGADGSDIVVSGAPVIDTKHSFSLAVWVVMNGPTSAPSGWQTVVAQCGSTSEGVALEYDAGSDRWAFDMPSADSATAARNSVLSKQAPSKTNWYHLVATYNAANHTMSLYVNKVLQGTTLHNPTWAARGPLTIGSGISGGTTTNWLHGAVSDVRVWNTALTQSQVTVLG